MSLKSFHFVFIGASIALAFGVAAWCLARYANTAAPEMLAGAVISFVAGVGMIFYARHVVHKLKSASL